MFIAHSKLQAQQSRKLLGLDEVRKKKKKQNGATPGSAGNHDSPSQRRNSLGRAKSPARQKTMSQRFSSFRSRNSSVEKSQGTPTTASSSKDKEDGPNPRLTLPKRSSEDILQQMDGLMEKDDDSMKQLIVTTNDKAQDCEVSQLTMQTKDFIPRSVAPVNLKDRQSSLKRLAALMGDCEVIMSESDSFREKSEKSETNLLLTFQRVCPEEAHKVYSTTLNGKANAEPEETMEDLVKRLQKMGNTSGVLKFARHDIDAIKAGTKQVVFSLLQVKGAVFNKHEFGKMTVSDVMELTSERPILIAIDTEDVAQGESIDIF